jgi:hypothetical protein
VLGALAGDLGRVARLVVDARVRVVVVRALYVESDEDDRAVRPAHILGVLRPLPALGRFAVERERLVAEALVGRVEDLPLVGQQLLSGSEYGSVLGP